MDYSIFVNFTLLIVLFRYSISLLVFCSVVLLVEGGFSSEAVLLPSPHPGDPSRRPCQERGDPPGAHVGERGVAAEWAGGHLHVYCGCGERDCGLKLQPGNIKEDGFENQIISGLETFT